MKKLPPSKEKLEPLYGVAGQRGREKLIRRCTAAGAAVRRPGKEKLEPLYATPPFRGPRDLHTGAWDDGDPLVRRRGVGMTPPARHLLGKSPKGCYEASTEVIDMTTLDRHTTRGSSTRTLERGSRNDGQGDGLTGPAGRVSPSGEPLGVQAARGAPRWPCNA